MRVFLCVQWEMKHLLERFRMYAVLSRSTWYRRCPQCPAPDPLSHACSIFRLVIPKIFECLEERSSTSQREDFGISFEGRGELDRSGEEERAEEVHCARRGRDLRSECVDDFGDKVEL